MRIAQVVLHSCIRANKISWLLMDVGNDVHLVSERLVDAHGWKDFNSTTLVHTGQFRSDGIVDFSHLHRTMRSVAQMVDLVHFHNEPDWPVGVIRDAIGDKPLVYDIHDMVSQRTKEVDEWEKKAFDACSAFSVVSQEYQDIVRSRSSKPCIQILSCVPRKLFPKVRRIPERGGLVYEGGLKGKAKGHTEQFEFRSWADVFQRISLLNVPVFAYPSDPSEDFSEYRRAGVLMLEPLPYHEMLKNLTVHEAGIVGSPFPTGAFDGALPNKMWEYIAAGIPVIAYNAPTARRFLEGTGLGKGVDHLEEIPEVLDQFWEEKTRDFVWQVRTNWTMDRQICKLTRLYKDLLGLPLDLTDDELRIAAEG